jgi:hypothetical protein
VTKLTVGLLIGLFGAGVTCAAAATLMAALHGDAASHYSAADYAHAGQFAASAYQAARARCDTLARTQKELCVSQAHAAERHARAEAEGRYLGTAKARRDAGVAAADATYWEARNACAGLPARKHVACVREAKAERANSMTQQQQQTQVALSAK